MCIRDSLRTRVQVERLWTALILGSAPIVVYGLAQAVGLDPLDWRTDAASPVLSTVGRANFLGSYLVLVVGLTAGRAVLDRRRWPHRPRRPHLPPRGLVAVLLLGGQLACLALTQARGAWVGLGAAALTFGLAWASATRDKRLVTVVLVMAILSVGFIALLNWPGGPLAPLAHLPGLDRLATLARTDAGSTAARITIWQATLPLIVHRPWLGYGPETMQAVFVRIFPPQLVYYQGRHTTVDRAHNLWLDLGMSAGLAGVVAFGALLVGFVRLAWRGLRNATASTTASTRGGARGGARGRQPSVVYWERAIWAALAAAVVGHLANLQFSFDLTASATVFWLTLALAAALGRGLVSAAPSFSGPPTEGNHEELPLPPLLVYLPPTLVILALIGLLCGRPLLADVAYWKFRQVALRLQDTRPLEERLAAVASAVRLWPLEPEYRLGLAWVFLQTGDFAAAEAQLAAADQLNPEDPHIWAARGDLYVWWEEVEPGRYTQAEAAYRRTLELAPNVATYHTSLALALARQGRLAEGVAELERAVALDATDGVAYRHLADLYQALGRETEAAWARREAARWGDQ